LLTGVDTNVSVTAPTPNASCDASAIDHTVYGASYPWGGHTHHDSAQTEFTCNKCPNGHPHLQGSFALIGNDENDELDPDLPLTSDWIEVLFVDGNTYYSRLHDATTNDTWEYRGFYFCSQQPENPHERIIWVPTEVIQAGPAGNQVQVGRASVSDVVLSSQDHAGVINLFWFNDAALTGGTGGYYEYCKFGSQVNGKTCRNRFND
jgi:hypothetical protein